MLLILTLVYLFHGYADSEVGRSLDNIFILNLLSQIPLIEKSQAPHCCATQCARQI